MTAKDLITAYECGIDNGLLLAEQERDSEDFFDATGCAVYSARMCVPSTQLRRRQPHSEAWRAAKQASLDRFLALVVRAANEQGEKGRDAKSATSAAQDITTL